MEEIERQYLGLDDEGQQSRGCDQMQPSKGLNHHHQQPENDAHRITMGVRRRVASFGHHFWHSLLLLLLIHITQNVIGLLLIPFSGNNILCWGHGIYKVSINRSHRKNLIKWWKMKWRGKGKIARKEGWLVSVKKTKLKTERWAEVVVLVLHHEKRSLWNSSSPCCVYWWIICSRWDRNKFAATKLMATLSGLYEINSPNIQTATTTSAVSSSILLLPSQSSSVVVCYLLGGQKATPSVSVTVSNRNGLISYLNSH